MKDRDVDDKRENGEESQMKTMAEIRNYENFRYIERRLWIWLCSLFFLLTFDIKKKNAKK